jgi:hypothetical protein
MIKYARHARRRIRWRKISEAEIEQTVYTPDRVEATRKNRLNAYKKIEGRLLKVTYLKEKDTVKIITAVWKGE